MEKKPSENIPVTKVIEKKLGRNQAVGLAFNDKNDPKEKKQFGEIHIDPRQTSLDYFDTLIHEKLHMMHPSWSEKKVATEATQLAKFLWRNKFRKVYL